MIFKIADSVRVFRNTPNFDQKGFGAWHISRSDKQLGACGYLSWQQEVEFANISDTKPKDRFCVNCFPKHFERVYE